MKRFFYLIISFICIGGLCACSQTEESKIVNSWDCTVARAEMVDDNADVITYSNEKIVATTGVLTFENENDFAILVHYHSEGIVKKVLWLEANSKIVAYGMIKDTEYTIGVSADVTEGTEIKLIVHDGIMNLVEAESGWRKPISVEKAIKIAQKYIDKTEKLIITNYDNPAVDVIVGYENMPMVEVNTREWKYVDPNKIIGRELYQITFCIEDDDTPIILYVDKYKGKLLGAAITM